MPLDALALRARALARSAAGEGINLLSAGLAGSLRGQILLSSQSHPVDVGALDAIPLVLLGGRADDVVRFALHNIKLRIGSDLITGVIHENAGAVAKGRKDNLEILKRRALLERTDILALGEVHVLGLLLLLPGGIVDGASDDTHGPGLAHTIHHANPEIVLVIAELALIAGIEILGAEGDSLLSGLMVSLGRLLDGVHALATAVLGGNVAHGIGGDIGGSQFHITSLPRLALGQPTLGTNSHSDPRQVASNGVIVRRTTLPETLTLAGTGESIAGSQDFGHGSCTVGIKAQEISKAIATNLGIFRVNHRSSIQGIWLIVKVPTNRNPNLLTMDEHRRKWYEENKEELNRKKREKHLVNRDAILVKKRARYRQNREILLQKAKEYRDNNRDKIRVYERKRRRVDPLWKLAKNLRARIHQALGGLSKSDSTVALLGCSPEEALKHIEGLFLPGMTWDNYGYRGWHIDHIKPIASFDLSDPEQQKAAFHYTNLQPLWWKENLSKGDRPQVA